VGLWGWAVSLVWQQYSSRCQRWHREMSSWHQKHYLSALQCAECVEKDQGHRAHAYTHSDSQNIPMLLTLLHFSLAWQLFSKLCSFSTHKLGLLFYMQLLSWRLLSHTHTHLFHWIALFRWFIHEVIYLSFIDLISHGISGLHSWH